METQTIVSSFAPMYQYENSIPSYPQQSFLQSLYPTTQTSNYYQQPTFHSSTTNYASMTLLNTLRNNNKENNTSSNTTTNNTSNTVPPPLPLATNPTLMMTSNIFKSQLDLIKQHAQKCRAQTQAFRESFAPKV